MLKITAIYYKKDKTMKEVKETPKGRSLSTEEKEVKQPYVKPESTVVKLELEQPLLNGGSNFGNGGRW